MRIDIPADVWAAAKTAVPAVGWDAVPPGAISIRLGTGWAGSLASAILRVPSVIVPEEGYILINPAHPDARLIRAEKVRRWLYDPRVR